MLTGSETREWFVQRKIFSSSYDLNPLTFKVAAGDGEAGSRKWSDQLPVHRGLHTLGYHWQVF
jgi:hypothetical protein